MSSESAEDDLLPARLAIRIRGLAKRYRRQERWLPGISLRDDLQRMLRFSFLRRSHTDQDGEFAAIDSFDLDVEPGERVAILGGNGAGKSTLLRMLSRVVPPSHGVIALRGRVACMLEVGTGFHPELSGRENIYLGGALLGMQLAEINARFSDIVAFSEVGPALDSPVKHYSSGMYVRLAFSIAAHLDPDILIIDEVLAVGDLAFRDKSIARLLSSPNMQTVLFVSHDPEAVRSLCTRGVVLDHGRKVFDGAIEAAIDCYRTTIG